jgi:hypothetical protein
MKLTKTLPLSGSYFVVFNKTMVKMVVNHAEEDAK